MAEILKNMGDAVIKLVLDIKWYDLIDIALVALVLYYCIKLVRQTRAFNLVKGIVFMGVVYFIVSTLNMSTSSLKSDRRLKASAEVISERFHCFLFATAIMLRRSFAQALQILPRQRQI